MNFSRRFAFHKADLEITIEAVTKAGKTTIGQFKSPEKKSFA